MANQTVAFVGLGYIGLPTAITFANSGLNVVGVDVKQDHVDSINAGTSPIIEKGLPEALTEVLEKETFRATTEMPVADTYIVAVPTPFDDNYGVDMKYIYSAAESIAPNLRDGALVILESTSAPKTTAKMAQRLLELRPDVVADGDDNPDGKPVIYFAHCPERILPGNAMEELITNDRIIGGMTPEATRKAKEVYATFCTGELLETDDVTAELAKLTENSFRDVNIAFANELSLISDKLGVNVWELINLANHHPRVNILQPGPGVGGHCIAVDPWFIVSSAPLDSRLIRTAREINDGKPHWVIGKVEDGVKETNTDAIAVFGLAFKPNIDDLRESPALEIATRLAERYPNKTIHAVEPNVQELPAALKLHENVQLSTIEDAVAKSGVVAMLVDHNEFKNLDTSILEGKHVVDTKGIWGLD